MIEMLAESTQPVLDIPKIITDVHNFYNDAWTNLLVLFGFAIAVFGAIIPFWLERGRRATFELSKSEVMSALERRAKDISDAFSKSVAVGEVAFEERIKALEKDTRKLHFNGLHGAYLQIADSIDYEGGTLLNVIGGLMMAIACGIQGDIGEDQMRRHLQRLLERAREEDPPSKEIKQLLGPLPASFDDSPYVSSCSGELQGIRDLIS